MHERRHLIAYHPALWASVFKAMDSPIILTTFHRNTTYFVEPKGTSPGSGERGLFNRKEPDIYKNHSKAENPCRHRANRLSF